MPKFLNHKFFFPHKNLEFWFLLKHQKDLAGLGSMLFWKQ